MAPIVFTARHAQGDHNVDNKWRLYDATLTPLGKEQCAKLCETFTEHGNIDLVVASPLRRTIQTAVYSFGPVLKRSEVPFILHPLAQEASERNCNIGLEKQELQEEVRRLFEEDKLEFDLEKIEYDEVVAGWNSKKGKWAPSKEALEKRAADMRSWLFQRPEKVILLVTHGAFLHYFTEDWEGFHQNIGSAFKNCEVRQFTFTEDSAKKNAHIQETNWSRQQREKESDPTVISEMVNVEGVRSVM